MGLRDRRRGSENVAAKIEPSGRAAMPHDPRMASRNQSDNLRGSRAEIYRGRVVHSLPQFGWHQVAFEGAGIMAAEPTGHADKWGTQSIHVYQPGAQVLCAVNHQRNTCVVLAQIPDVIGDRNDQYVMASSMGSQINLEKDPAAQVFLDAIKENDDTSSYEINPKQDQITGDWGCRTNTGVMVNVDSWGVDLSVDDITGISLDLLAQTVDVSGRSGTIETDGVRIHSDTEAYCVQLSLGSCWIQDAYDTEDRKDLDSKLDPEKIQYDTYNLMRGYNLLVMGSQMLWELGFVQPDWVAEMIVSPSRYDQVSGRVRAIDSVKYSVADRSLQTGKSVTMMATELFTVETLMPKYTPGETEKELHLKIARRLKKFRLDANRSQLDLCPIGPHTAVLEAMASMQDVYLSVRSQLGGDAAPESDLPEMTYLLTDRHEVGVLYNKTNDSVDTNAIHKAVLENESVLVSGLITHENLTFDRHKVQKNGQMRRRDLRSMVTVDEITGDILLINEHGSGIRISGDTVFIEGGNIRMVSRKDVRVFARDVTLASNRNVTISSNRHTRVYSAINTSILGGSGGFGGVIIESHGTNTAVDLPDNAEKAIYAGVTIKSTRAPITALGGDIALRAGDYLGGVPGTLLLTSDGGDALIASKSRVVLHSNVERLDTYGSDYNKPTSSHMFGSEQVIFKGTLAADNIWSQGSIVAKSSIQAITGRVADSTGGLMGRVIAGSQMLTTLQQINSNRTRSLQSWSQSADQLREQFKGQGKILNQVIAAEMSSGYVKAEKASAHYGAGSMSDTLPHLYEESMPVPTDPFRVHTVEYKTGSSRASKTYAYPGKTGKTIACMVQSPTIVKIASADEWDNRLTSISAQTFEQIFGTVRDIEE